MWWTRHEYLVPGWLVLGLYKACFTIKDKSEYMLVLDQFSIEDFALSRLEDFIWLSVKTIAQNR